MTLGLAIALSVMGHLESEEMGEFDKLIERVKAATDVLDYRTALEINLMKVGRLTEFEPFSGRDEYGGYFLTYQMDMFGGGRMKCTMRESDLPDRSIDAAIALVKRLVGEDEALEFLSMVATETCEDTVNGSIKTIPLAILAAILAAILPVIQAKENV